MQLYVDSPTLQMRKLSTERSGCLPKVTQFIRDSISRQAQTVWASQTPAPGPIPQGSHWQGLLSVITPPLRRAQGGSCSQAVQECLLITMAQRRVGVGGEVVAGMCGDRGGRRQWGWTRPLAAIKLLWREGSTKAPSDTCPNQVGYSTTGPSVT